MFPFQSRPFFARITGRACVRASMDTGISGEPELGAHLVTPRSGYEHHGIYVGNGRVVHYAGLSISLRGPVEETSLGSFAANHPVVVRVHPMPAFTGLEAVRRARSRLGEDKYRLLTNNCEHLCLWVVHGKKRSRQVEACLVHPGHAARAALGLYKILMAARSTGRLTPV